MILNVRPKPLNIFAGLKIFTKGKQDMTERTKFIKWFVRPFNRLKRIKSGDGGFVILSLGISLCERFFRIKSSCVTPDSLPPKFHIAAAKEFGCTPDTFQIFWMIYRHGIQHRGQPQKWIMMKRNNSPKKVKTKTGWLIGDEFNHYPTLCRKNGKIIACIDPKKFTSFVLKTFLKNPELLRRSVRHQFGNIYRGSVDSNC